MIVTTMGGDNDRDNDRDNEGKTTFLLYPPQSHWVAVILTFLPTSAMLFPMGSLRQTGSGLFSARAGRCRPGAAEKRFLINLKRAEDCEAVRL